MQFKTTSGREFAIADFRTRKLDREYQEAVSEWVMVRPDWIADFPAKNVQRANDILVMGMTGMSQESLDSLSSLEFNEILQEILGLEQKKIVLNSSEISSEL